jgi:glycosyltransferase involved in cell wall biosynthesis
MKLLVVGPTSVHVTSFIESIKNSTYQIYYLSEEELIVPSVEENYVVNFRKLGIFTIFKNIRSLKKILSKLKPSVIHIHQINRLAFFLSIVAVRLKIPYVVTAWGSDVLLMPQKNILFYLMVKFVLKHSSFVTGDSKEMISVMNGISKDEKKYQLLQYGIEIIPSSKKEKFIFSNRLHEPLYQIEKVIGFFHEFVKENNEWKLVIAGNGSETYGLKKMVQDLELVNFVTFVGWLNKESNNDYYSRAYIYISLPKSDGMSVSVLEAMSAGCIPIVPDLDVSKEWIKDGFNGVICNFENNPLYEALLLDNNSVATYNLNLIEKNASRMASNSIFYKIYNRTQSI